MAGEPDRTDAVEKADCLMDEDDIHRHGIMPGFFKVEFDDFLKPDLSLKQIQEFQKKLLEAAEETVPYHKEHVRVSENGYVTAKGFPTLGISLGFIESTLTVLKSALDRGPDRIGRYYQAILGLLSVMVILQVVGVGFIIAVMLLRYKPEDSCRKRLLMRINGIISAIALVLLIIQTAATVFYADASTGWSGTGTNVEP